MLQHHLWPLAGLVALTLAACPAAQPKDTPPPTPADSAAGPTDDAPAALVSAQACGPTAPCGDDAFCRFPAAAACGAGDVTGVCEARPRGCRRDCPGVCGCDGQRHCNTCAAQARGVAVQHDGPCADAPPAATPCGELGALPCP